MSRSKTNVIKSSKKQTTIFDNSESVNGDSWRNENQ